MTKRRRNKSTTNKNKGSNGIYTSPVGHILDAGDIDDFDEVDGDCQLSLVYCTRHKQYEWHNLPFTVIGKRKVRVQIRTRTLH